MVSTPLYDDAVYGSMLLIAIWLVFLVYFETARQGYLSIAKIVMVSY